ncbi:MAG: type II secretion system protein [Synechococcaceae cyanobacterium]|nr:type II secretion system protein [Synechococcaceae cyanobacterium]
MKDERGMTILELLVGLAVLGMVLAASLPAFRNMLDGYAHRNSVTAVTGRMFLTRQMAVRERTPFVVQIEEGQFSIFRDDDEDGTRDGDERELGPYPMSDGVQIQNVSWPNDRITFFPNGGASQTADLRVVDAKGRSKTIRVSSITGNTEVLP